MKGAFILLFLKLAECRKKYQDCTYTIVLLKRLTKRIQQKTKRKHFYYIFSMNKFSFFVMKNISGVSCGKERKNKSN